MNTYTLTINGKARGEVLGASHEEALSRVRYRFPSASKYPVELKQVLFSAECTANDGKKHVGPGRDCEADALDALRAQLRATFGIFSEIDPLNYMVKLDFIKTIKS